MSWRIWSDLLRTVDNSDAIESYNTVIILTSLRDVAGKAVARGSTAGETITLRIYYMPISKGVFLKFGL
jgi:hypothetical protein